MKKFKNIKLMLLGLLAMGSMNAFALDGDFKSDGSRWFQVTNEAKGQVTFVGISKTVAEPKEIVIPATIDLPDDDGVTKKTYKVIAASNTWWAGTDYTNTRNLTAAPLESLTFEFRTDWDADMKVDGTSTVVHSYDCLSNGAFQASLKKLVIKEAHKVHTLPLLNMFTALEELDLEGVTNDGDEITVIANFVKGLNNLKSVKLPKNQPLAIANNAFDGICGTDKAGKPTAVTGIDISNATSIGAEAFRNAYITEVTIGENVSEMNPYAFVAPDINKAYLTKVTWKSSKIMGGDPAQPQVKAAFPGQINIKEVVVEANKVTSIETGAFTSSTADDFVLDLSKAPALAKVAGALPNVAYKKVLLQGSGLAGDDLKTILGIDLASKSKATLEELTLPDGLTDMTAGEFNGFTKLKKIGVNITNIPDNAFKGATVLEGLELGNKVETIGKNAFDGTNLKSITIPGGVTTIKDAAFANIKPNGADGKPVAVPLDLDGAVKLNSLGTGVFKDTNIGATVDFTNTAVTVIPASAFEKTTANKFLTGVTLKEGSASSKTSIGASAFKNNEGLASVNKLNQANYDFSANPLDGKPGIAVSAFENTALDKVELDATPITVIATSAFAKNEELKSVKLNAATSFIDVNAFAGDYQLATVVNLNNDKLTTISAGAFAGSALTELNLDAATSLTSIGAGAFAYGYKQDDKKNWTVYNPTLTKITFPEEKNTKKSEETEWKDFTNKITTIGSQAFLWQKGVTEINNLKDTKIKTLNELFTNVPSTYAIVPPSTTPTDADTPTDKFAKGQDQTEYCPAGLETIELPDTSWTYMVSGTATTIELTNIADYALQGLGISEIVIPSSVSTFGDCVLQANVNLKNVYWYDAIPTSIHKYTFRGDSNLEKFYFMTVAPVATNGLEDIFFYWCSKEKLRVYVTSESLKILEAQGYTTANAKYSKLNDELTDEIEFADAGFNKADNMYYRTFYNTSYSTWIKASDDVKVYTAQFNGAKVEMVEADVEGGYYKMERLVIGSNDSKAVAIIASKTKTLEVEYYALAGNNKSTLKEKYNEMKVTSTEKSASKLSYFFKLGKGPQGIGFYRITTGKFKAGAVYLQAADAARDFYGINGEETGIKAIEENVEFDNVPVYNLQGIRVNEAQKGMFIKNGKKYIVK
jgi:hypothetical protein